MSTEPPTLRYPVDDDESLSTAIVTALSEAKGRDITEDECVLYDAVDPDALDKLFRGGGRDDAIKVEFATHGAIVVLWADGEKMIEVQDLEDG